MKTDWRPSRPLADKILIVSIYVALGIMPRARLAGHSVVSRDLLIVAPLCSRGSGTAAGARPLLVSNSHGGTIVFAGLGWGRPGLV